MPSTKELRRRIRSVKNISQITKAMQMVAATKMRRSQNQALAGRPYSQTLQNAVLELMPAINLAMNPLLQQNSSSKIGILLLTTDKSLCGSLNANVLRLAQQFCNASSLRHPRLDRGSGMNTNQSDSRLSTSQINSAESSRISLLRGTSRENDRIIGENEGKSNNAKAEVEFFTLGKKGRDFVVKTGKLLNSDFENSDVLSYKSAKQIANVLIQSYLEQKIGELYILFPDFISTLKQEPKLEKVLPISSQELTNGLNIEGLENNISQDMQSSQNKPSFPRKRDSITQELDSSLRGNNGKKSDQYHRNEDFIFDTAKEKLLDFVLTHFVQQKIYQSMLETKASEHSSRMIAMKNATDSAKELVSDLNLAYNRTRQEGITKELLEITSALSALE